LYARPASRISSACCGIRSGSSALQSGLASSVLVGDDQLDVPSEAQRPVGAKALDGSQIVGLQSETVIVESFDWRVDDGRRLEALERRPAGFDDPRRHVLEPRLVGGDLASLRGTGLAAELLKALPTEPAELVVVPHCDERPAGPRVLDVGILQIRPIDRSIIRNRRRHVVVRNLLGVRIANNVAEAAIVHALRAIFGVPDDLVDEVAEVQHEVEPVGFRRPLVFENHPPIRVLRALIDVLAAHERELHRPVVVL
jgi:hypothetical protein